MSKQPLPPFAGVAALSKFMSARERHRVGKETGRKVDKPDAIISEYRFCNVRRNDDRVTKWIHEHYMARWRDDPCLWFALVVARLFNNEEALAAIADYVLPFDPDNMKRVLHRRAMKGEKNFNPAYIVSTNGQRMDKVDYVVNCLLKPMWKNRVSTFNGIKLCNTLNAVHQILMEFKGLASFMAGQVIGDLKYAEPERWTDFWSFATSGPGSKRGLNRVYGLDKDTPMSEGLFRERLAVLSVSIHKLLRSWKPVTGQDLQNCLCEFDKYERARLGEGRPKQTYKPKENV